MQASTTPQPLAKSQASVLLTGNTLYLDIGKDQPTVLFYDASGAVQVLHASGVRDSGQWTLREDGSYCIDWVNGPKGSLSRVLWQAGDIQIRDLADTPRGRLLKIVPGRVPELA